ncbi:MAG: hypothetical protein A2283_20840 [Lentisphaerae bacterium RIFOXYA12_FULL_48_11]|nr:MAG: hypothetical protein A2283_20840 [Lentisphaerae bacterium RIFOXYA12_FULL_48_11]
MTKGDRSITISLEGVWDVENNILTWTIKKTNTPDLMPVGKTANEEILEIDNNHIKYKGIDDQIETETKIHD